MKKNRFNPTEIIFSVTEACNLNCKHCFVSRSPKKLNEQDAKNFLISCKNTSIDRVGFSGGEPFLNLDFIINMSKFCVEHDFMFDQITTNGDWWKTPEDLRGTLQLLYDSGYDGKFCLSWDEFHGQSKERMDIFIKEIEHLFGAEALNIQYCVPFCNESNSQSPEKSEILKILEKEYPELTVYKLPQSFMATEENAWKSKKWFKEDYCQGPGNILFVHPDGRIAPCCGFANENEKLIIGNVKNTFEEVMLNAENNWMIKQCYEKGLSKLTKKREIKKNIPGKTDDICTFCDWICKR